MCELIYVALDGSSTHLFKSGLALHIGLALDRGATPLQAMEVLHLATVRGLDGLALGVTILDEELAAGDGSSAARDGRCPTADAGAAGAGFGGAPRGAEADRCRADLDP
jgi:hypothetical protein